MTRPSSSSRRRTRAESTSALLKETERNIVDELRPRAYSDHIHASSFPNGSTRETLQSVLQTIKESSKTPRSLSVQSPFLSLVNNHIKQWGGLTRILSIALLFLVSCCIVWLSNLTIYTVAYFTYVPQHVHSIPIYFDFTSSAAASISLRNMQLRAGQRYQVFVHLNIPDSDANLSVGNLMLTTKIHSANNETLFQSKMPTLMPFASPLVRSVRTLLKLPFVLLSYIEESVPLRIQLDSSFTPMEDNFPMTALIHLSRAPPLTLSSAEFILVADFTGLRYWMYHWAFTMAFLCIGLSSCLGCWIVAFICLYLLWRGRRKWEDLELDIPMQSLDQKL